MSLPIAPFAAAALPFAAAALIAAAILLIGSWPWRGLHPRRSSFYAVLGTGLGFVAGCRLLGLMPHWPPGSGFDRAMWFIMPLVFVVELAGALAGRFAWLLWLPRLVIAATAVRVILHGSKYITDQNTPGTPEWTTQESIVIFAALAAVLLGLWAAMHLLLRRTPSEADASAPGEPGALATGAREPGALATGESVLEVSAPGGFRKSTALSVGLAIAGTCAGAAVVVMLNGYASDSQYGLVLGAAIAGSATASWVLKTPADLSGIVGIGLVGAFCLLLLGRFFGNLSTEAAVIVFLAPALCWLPELPPRLHTLRRLAMVGIPVLIVVILARQKFDEDSLKNAPKTKGSPSHDYDPSDYEKYK